MESLPVSRVKCPSCDGLGFRGINQPINFIPSLVDWCDCEEGRAARLHWMEKVQQKQAVNFAKLFTESGIPLEYEDATIDNLSRLADPGKAEAIAAATELLETGAVGGKRSLCVIGSYGVGKTYLLSAVLREYLSRGESCLWIALSELFREVQRGYGQGDDIADKRIDAACDAGILLIDDFGKVNIQGYEKEDKVRIIDTIINERHNNRRPTLITSNLNPEEWKAQFGQRTSDRVIKMCEIVAMGGQNLRLI